MLSRRGASFQKGRFSFPKRPFLFRHLVIFCKKIERFLVRGVKATILPDRVRKYQTQNSAFFLHRLRRISGRPITRAREFCDDACKMRAERREKRMAGRKSSDAVASG